MFLRLVCLVLCLLLSLPAMSAADAVRGNQQDEDAVKALGVSWQEAWNRRDAAGLTALLADDMDFVTVLGPKGWLRDKSRFRDVHATMFTTYFTDSTWRTLETHVRFLRDDLAIARVHWSTTGDKVRHVAHGAPREGMFLWVVEKRDGRWLVVAAQNTETMPVLAGQ